MITVIGLVVPPLLLPALWVLAVLTNLTALQRIRLISREAGPGAFPPVPDPDRRADPAPVRPGR